MKDVSDESISLSLQLIKVSELARRGRYKEAETLLAPNGSVPENSVALHTLAALVTKQGANARALALWKTVQQRDPKNLEAREMIAAIETWMARPEWFRFLPAGAATALVLLVAVVGWAAVRPATRPASSTPAIAPAPTAATPSSAGPAARPAAVPAPAPASDAPPVKFQLPAAKPKR